MRIRNFPSAFLFFAAVILLAPSPANADDMLTKLGRGITNVATSPFEILVQPFRIGWADQKPYNSLGQGIVQSLYYAVARCLTGVYDIVTFPFPVPADYKPVFFPETLMEGYAAVNRREWPYPKYGFGAPPPAAKEKPAG